MKKIDYNDYSHVLHRELRKEFEDILTNKELDKILTILNWTGSVLQNNYLMKNCSTTFEGQREFREYQSSFIEGLEILRRVLRSRVQVELIP